MYKIVIQFNLYKKRKKKKGKFCTMYADKYDVHNAKIVSIYKQNYLLVTLTLNFLLINFLS